MKTNNLSHPVFAYILDCIEIDDNENATPVEKMQYVADRLKTECLPNYKNRYTGTQKVITEWLQGIALPIAFRDYEILELAKQWGSLPENPTERQEDKILNNYWSFMAMKIMQLLKHYKIDYQ